MKYLFDTNVFIRSKNELPEDIWPTFWMRIAELIRDGKIYTSEKVKEEIERGDDELTQWMKSNASSEFYCSVDSDILNEYSRVQNWAQKCNQFTPTALDDFARVADAYLVATAAAKGWTLVTYETSAPECRRRVKIPDACNAMGVGFCDLNTAFRDLGVRV